jgi:hypothetical protein
MGRGRKPKPWWDNEKEAFYVWVKGKKFRLGTRRPDGWSDEGWINFTVFSADCQIGPLTLWPAYSATPEFVRSCMPARGRRRLSARRLRRVAKMLHEYYGHDESSLMDADVTGEVDWEGAPELRGLAWKVEEITSLIYDQDRNANPKNWVFADRSPCLALGSSGRRCGHVPGTVEGLHDLNHDIKPREPRYVDNGETAKAGPSPPPPETPYEAFLPDGRTWRFATAKAVHRQARLAPDSEDQLEPEDLYEADGDDEPFRSKAEADSYVRYLEACRDQKIPSIPYDSWMKQGQPEPADAKDMDPSVEYLPLIYSPYEETVESYCLRRERELLKPTNLEGGAMMQA